VPARFVGTLLRVSKNMWVIGLYSFLASRLGHLKGKKTGIVVLCGAQGRSGNGSADLSKTAGAEAKAEA
jgi:hypothetical protein